MGAPLKSLGTSQHYHIVGFHGGPWSGPDYAKRQQSTTNERTAAVDHRARAQQSVTNLICVTTGCWLLYATRRLATYIYVFIFLSKCACMDIYCMVYCMVFIHLNILINIYLIENFQVSIINILLIWTTYSILRWQSHFIQQRIKLFE